MISRKKKKFENNSISRNLPTYLLMYILIFFIGQKLDDYLIKLPVPSRVIRMPTRDGLITARLTGAQQASGSGTIILCLHFC